MIPHIISHRVLGGLGNLLGYTITLGNAYF